MTEFTLDRPDGTRLQGTQHGDGPTVVLAHGFGLSRASWDEVSAMLTGAGFTAVSYDHRGHGQSTVGAQGVGSAQLRDDLRALLVDRDLDQVIIVAHSMGTFIALAALDDPDTRKHVRHLVLVNPITGGFANGAVTARLQGPLVRYGIAQCLAKHHALGCAMARMTLHHTAHDHVVEATRRSLVAIPPSATPMINVLRTESVAEVLPTITTPTTVLASTQDTTTPEWHARLIVRTMPNARLQYVTRTGHMTQWEAPRRIVETVIAADRDTVISARAFDPEPMHQQRSQAH